MLVRLEVNPVSHCPHFSSQNEDTQVCLLTATNIFLKCRAAAETHSQLKEEIQSLRWPAGQLEDIKIEMYTDVPSTDSCQHQRYTSEPLMTSGHWSVSPMLGTVSYCPFTQAQTIIIIIHKLLIIKCAIK